MYVQVLFLRSCCCQVCFVDDLFTSKNRHWTKTGPYKSVLISSLMALNLCKHNIQTGRSFIVKLHCESENLPVYIYS